MALDKEFVLKIFSVVITAVLYLPSWASAQRYDADTMMMAKRGLGGARNQLKFKGDLLPKTTYAARHDDIYLECEVGGIPTPTIHWLKDGERISEDPTRDYLDDEAYVELDANQGGEPMLRLGKVKSRLYLDCISKSDEAEYTCVAQTPTERIAQSTQLKIEHSFNLQAKGKCLAKTKKDVIGEPARIHMWSAVRLEYERAPAQLFCRAEGYPAPKCSWRFSEDEEPIPNGEVLPNGDLLLRDLRWSENMGLYFCRCENEGGVDEISTFLYPTSP